MNKHGIRTVLGTLQEALDGEYLIGASSVLDVLIMAGHSDWGAITAGGLVIGKMAISLLHKLVDLSDAECGPNSEIAYIHQLKHL